MQTTMSNNDDNIESAVVLPPAAPVTAEASIPLSIEPCTLSTMEEHITQLETQLQQLQQSIQSKSAEINHAKRRINYVRKSQIKNATTANNKDGTTKRKRFRKVCTKNGCTSFAINGGVCRKHGAHVTLCSTEGCTNVAKKHGLCKRHGAYDPALEVSPPKEKKRKITGCSHPGCTLPIHKGGECISHAVQREMNERLALLKDSGASGVDV